jgi:hypothetical protein
MSGHTSFYKTLQETGPDLAIKTVPDQSIQAVPLTPPVTFNVLAHDAPPSGSGYCSIKTAYAENTKYNFVPRKCDGNL